jgi:prevent-host-death family protein
MKTASLTAVKNGLSHYVDHVRHGGRVRILSRGVAVADIVPVAEGSPRSDEDRWELDALERQGLARSGPGGECSELDRPGPRVKGNVGTAAIRADRRGR